MRQNPDVKQLSLRVSAGKQRAQNLAELPDIIVVEIDGKTLVEECSADGVKALTGEIRALINGFLGDLQ